MKLREKHRVNFSLTAVFFTFLIDSLGWAIVFPIFAPYFLDSQNTLFSSDVSVETRITILGLFLTAFSLGQFFGAPILGEYADRHGRKKALLGSVFFMFIGLGVSAWGMENDLLVVLFIGRLITGFFAGNTTICLACISDLKGSEKVSYFGYLSFIAGVSFILGAFLGGKFSDSSLSSYFFPALPFWIATALTFLNFLFILWGFADDSHLNKNVKFDLLKAWHNIKMVLNTKKIKPIYTIYFMFLFAWTILLQFTPPLMVQNYNFTNSNIGDLALFMGICWALGSGVLIKFFLRFFSSLRVLEICLLGFAVLSALMIYPTQAYSTLAIVGGCVIIAGLAWPLCTELISNTAPKESQGKIFGISQSVQSLATTLAPMAAGLATQFFFGLCFILGALASLIAVVIYFILKE